MLTESKKAAAREVHARLKAVEVSVGRLHRALAALRDEFIGELTEDEFVAFGGGTDKPVQE